MGRRGEGRGERGGKGEKGVRGRRRGGREERMATVRVTARFNVYNRPVLTLILIVKTCNRYRLSCLNLNNPLTWCSFHAK